MSMAITFDTLQFVKTLTEAEVPQKQAEAYAKAFKEAHDNSADGLATKQDLREAINEVKSDIKEVRREANVMNAQLKADILKWMVTLVMGQAAVIVSLIKLLPH